LQHFEARIAAVDGKAMIVCMSRDICVQLYNAIVTRRCGPIGTAPTRRKAPSRS
jgi:type I site-specific restriction-modification system R (restriction) subunit